MEYKVLIELYLPEIEEKYEAYIPINKTIGEIVGQLMNPIRNQHDELPNDVKPKLYNRHNYRRYYSSELVRNTDIRNGTELVAILRTPTATTDDI